MDFFNTVGTDFLILTLFYFIILIFFYKIKYSLRVFLFLYIVNLGLHFFQVTKEITNNEYLYLKKIVSNNQSLEEYVIPYFKDSKIERWELKSIKTKTFDKERKNINEEQEKTLKELEAFKEKMFLKSHKN